MVFVSEDGVSQDRGDCVGGSTNRRGIIVGLTGFSVWLGDSGCLFSDIREIAIVVRTQGGVLGAALREVFVQEAGVLQGAR